jgi:hypothetical protein
MGWMTINRIPCFDQGHMALFEDRYTHKFWANYNDRTATSLESWLIRGIIPKWPNISG